ncbi:NGG1p interacting factor NIF3 [Thermodesulfobium sp. 4217-1]|uniref:NGG1p interacting factor NIF3 n=1 Tax=Thermodesulfobium sp. 4217-1 TaxID=3120013 RepID=UPI0032221366
MKLSEVYKLAINMGIEADPRGKEEVFRHLERVKKNYEELSEKKKARFDKELLENPYSDSRILCGKEDQIVKGIFVGIDMEVPEIILADRLVEKGERIDLIFAHHPEGKSLPGLEGVMHLQEDILFSQGIPINVAENLMGSRISEVSRSVHPANHNRAVDAAKLLGFAFMNIHTPADNIVTKFLTDLFLEKKPETVGEVVDILLEIPEYKDAQAHNFGPKIVNGAEKSRCGKIWVDMTGGTSGSKDAYEKLSIAGIGTIVGMHMKEDHLQEAKKFGINVVIAGHMPSDSVGMNFILDEIEKNGVNIIPTSGLFRVRR